MNRLSVLQTIIDHIHAKTYLEIGVETGTIISNINAPNKIGVDPKFLFSKRLVLKKLAGIINFKAIAATSDLFFDKEADKVLRDGIDVALVEIGRAHV